MSLPRGRAVASSLLLIAVLLAPEALAANCDPAAPDPASVQPSSGGGSGWEGPDRPDFDDSQQVEPCFEPGQTRFGLHGQAGFVVGDSSGGFVGLDALVGPRLTKHISVLLRLNADLGAWSAPNDWVLTSLGVGLGGEYLQEFGPGMGLATGLTLGGWLLDACDGPCSLIPAVTVHLGLLGWPYRARDNDNMPLSHWSIGVSAGAGYDPLVERVSGRGGVYFGYDISPILAKGK